MLLEDVKTVLGSTLQISGRARTMHEGSPLLGAVPELDSMAVVTLINALEEHFGIAVEDDEISAATFETLGTLTKFVAQKLPA
jgi:acyl carrier protein